MAALMLPERSRKPLVEGAGRQRTGLTPLSRSRFRARKMESLGAVGRQHRDPMLLAAITSSGMARSPVVWRARACQRDERCLALVQITGWSYTGAGANIAEVHRQRAAAMLAAPEMWGIEFVPQNARPRP